MSEPLYKVKFLQQNEVVELVVRYISEESLMGFIELEEIVFQSGKETHFTRDEYKEEFSGLDRCYLPLHTLLRIDELNNSSSSSTKDKVDNVRRLPGWQPSTVKKDED